MRDLGRFYKETVYKYYFIQSSLKLFEVGTVLIPVRLREIKWSRAHSSPWQNQDSNPCPLDSKLMLLKNSALKAMKQDYVRAKNQCEQNHWGKGIYTQKRKKFNFTSRYPGLPSAQLVKNPISCNAGDPGSIPGLRRSPGEGKSYPLQYSGQENSMD